MTIPELRPTEHEGVDALVVDHYLEMLLAAGDRRAADVPADAALDAGLRDTARLLRSAMVRVHPSFRFEERLAARLAGMAAGARPLAAHGGGAQAAHGGGGAVVAFPGIRVALGSPADPPDSLLDAILRGDLDPSDAAAVDRAARTPRSRPLIVGGAITSAAISIVGVAWVAWRAGHPAAGAMARAARTAHARKGPTAALPGAGLGGSA